MQRRDLIRPLSSSFLQRGGSGVLVENRSRKLDGPGLPSVRTSMVELVPDAETSSANKVTLFYRTAGAVVDRVQKVEAADIVISSVPMIDQLQTQGKVVGGSRVSIAKVGVGAFVRKGTAKP